LSGARRELGRQLGDWRRARCREQRDAGANDTERALRHGASWTRCVGHRFGHANYRDSFRTCQRRRAWKRNMLPNPPRLRTTLESCDDIGREPLELLEVVVARGQDHVLNPGGFETLDSRDDLARRSQEIRLLEIL